MLVVEEKDRIKWSDLFANPMLQHGDQRNQYNALLKEEDLRSTSSLNSIADIEARISRNLENSEDLAEADEVTRICKVNEQKDSRVNRVNSILDHERNIALFIFNTCTMIFDYRKNKPTTFKSGDFSKLVYVMTKRSFAIFDRLKRVVIDK